MAGPPRRCRPGMQRGRDDDAASAPATACGAGRAAGDERARSGRWLNSLNRSISGPSELPRMVRNAGAILASSMLRARAAPSPSNAATCAARPAASAALSNLITSASASALATMADALSLAASSWVCGDLELLLGQGHGHLLLLLGLGRLLDDLLLGLDHLLLLLGQHDLDLQLRLGELLELLAAELGELLLGDLALLHRLGDLGAGAGSR